MSNISKAFENGKAFIPFILCGDPDIETTAGCIVEMEKAGASMIELEIPFSDATAEGPVIMECSIRALEKGITTDKIFEMVKSLREEKNVKIPFVFMTYANVVFSYGIERFCKRASELGVEGLILADVPYEEKDEFDGICKENGIDLISMITPTSCERTPMIVSSASGMIYIGTSFDSNGVEDAIKTEIPKLCASVRDVADIPCVTGFGISTPEQAAEAAKSADGILCGTGIIELIAKYKEDAPAHIGDYVKSMVSAIK